MKNMAISFLFIWGFAFSLFAQQNCADAAKVVKPVLSAEAAETYSTKLAEAEADLNKKPDDPEAIIWFGRRTAYSGNYKEAIGIYTGGIEKNPRDARLYRHRGHRLITLRCFDEAIRDFQTAARLIKGRPDEIEPDGLPNARNIPTSTLQSNIWYHLGLAYYLKGDFKNALKAYKNCLKVSKNPDMLVATTNWLYITLRHLGKTKEAEKVLRPISGDLDIIENDSYYKLLKLYQGRITADELLKEIGAGADDLSDASVGYGLGNWFLSGGEKEKAAEIFRRITSGKQWSSFGFIAAEAQIKRL